MYRSIYKKILLTYSLHLYFKEEKYRSLKMAPTERDISKQLMIFERKSFVLVPIFISFVSQGI